MFTRKVHWRPSRVPVRHVFLCRHSRPFTGPTLVAVKVMMCCTSLQVRQGRTCSMRATIPAASGAAADVPVWPSVQPVPFCMDQSDVTCADGQE